MNFIFSLLFFTKNESNNRKNIYRQISRQERGFLMSKRGENIYKRKDGRWEGRFAKGRKENGSIWYGSIYGRTYQEVKQRLYPLKIKYASLIQTTGRCATPLYKWGLQWVDELQKKVKPSTYSSYRYKLEHYIFPRIGEIELNQVTSSLLQELVDIWKKEGLKTSTIRVLFQLVKSCFSHAVKKGLLLVNPCQTVHLPKVEKRTVHSLTKGQQAQLVDVAKKMPLKKGLPTLLALNAGLRIGEIAAMTWENIDFESNTIAITHTYQRIPFYSIDGAKTQLIRQKAKTQASQRVIPMTQVIRKYLLQKKKRSYSPFVFSNGGRPCEPRLLTRYFQQLVKKANLSGVHFHQLRHTFATRCLERNRDIASISCLLGHASTQMTLDVYADSLIEQRVSVIQSLEK